MRVHFKHSLIVYRILSLLLWWSLVIHYGEAQIAFNVPCPNVNVVSDFDINKFSGVWFELESYPSIVDEFDICNSMTYTAEGDVLHVVSSWFNTSSNIHENVTGTARIINPEFGARLLVTFPSSLITESMSVGGNFWILETDYQNYALAFLCLSAGPNTSLQFLTSLSRERLPFAEGLDFIRQRVDALGLDRRFLKLNDQVSCSKNHQ